MIAFDGDALRWFHWENRRRLIKNWNELKCSMLKHFLSNSNGSLCEQFLALRQESTVEESRRKFMFLAAPLNDVSEEVLLSQFINGLDPMVKAEVRLLSPYNLNAAMKVAMKIKVKNRVAE